MRTRTGLLMPSVALLTIVAILVTGFVLGQLRGGAPGVAILSAVQQFATSAESSETTAPADGFIVADSGLPDAGAGQWQQPGAQPAAADEPAQAGAKQGSAAQHVTAPAAVSDAGVSDDPADADDLHIEEEELAPSSPRPDAVDGDIDLAAPSGGSTASAGALVVTTGRDAMTTPATLPSVDSVAQDGPAVLVAAVPDDEESESARRHEADSED
jgi:hypothetical protein